MKGTELIPRFGADASPDQATRRLVWLAMATLPARQTAMVRVPPLGIGRRLDKGTPREARLLSPLIGTSVAHRNSHANKLLDIAQEGHLLAVAQ